MAFPANHAAVLDRIDEELGSARAPTPQLFAKVTASACPRLSTLNKSGAAARLQQLIAAGAWTDAALVLIELEMPAWTVRRLVCEDGEWLCSLSCLPNLPMALDEPVEATHEILPLAVLRAFVEVRRRNMAASQLVARAPLVQPTPERMICCDNFA